MTYTKPENVTYTQMCIYIDEHVYEDNADTDLIYQYMYHILYMLASKACLFSKGKYYDPFAVYAASRIYLRYNHPKQYEVDAEGNTKLPKIKSILNYAKKTLYHLKVDFEQTEYSQVLSNTVVEEFTYNYDNVIRNAVDGLFLVEFESTLGDVCKTCKQFLSTLPYPKSSAEWLNIYVSVMLTFLSFITLKNKSQRRLQHLESTKRLKDSHLDKFYELERESTAVLFHLDASMHDYILVLARQLRSIVAVDLTDILHTAVDSGFELANLTATNFIVEQGEQNEDAN